VRTVHYDERRHHYMRIADGQAIPSATGLLKWAGKIPEAERSEFFARPYLERGKRVHRATLAYDQHEHPGAWAMNDALAMLPSDEEGYLRAYWRLRAELMPEYSGREVLRSWRGLVAGTIDACGVLRRMPRKPYAILDLKTGPKQKWHRWQLALYALMDGNPYALRVGCHLHADGTFAVEPYTDGSDLLYVSTLITKYWRAKHAEQDADDEALVAYA